MHQLHQVSLKPKFKRPCEPDMSITKGSEVPEVSGFHEGILHFGSGAVHLGSNKLLQDFPGNLPAGPCLAWVLFRGHCFV